MSRRDEFKKDNPNPAQRFLEWKSNEKTFQYYDKDSETNVSIKLPFKFLVLKEMHTVKGWSDASESAIYSNEVKYIGSEELNVRSFKGGEIAKGLYKDIKSRVKDFGGHYVKSIYIMTENNEIWNLQLKGSSVQVWGEFTQKTRSRLFDEWVEVTEFEERKKGSINYTVPVFKFNTSLSNDEGKKADEVYNTLDLYMKSYLDAKELSEKTPLDDVPPQNPVPVEAYAGEEVDDFPF